MNVPETLPIYGSVATGPPIPLLLLPLKVVPEGVVLDLGLPVPVKVPEALLVYASLAVEPSILLLLPLKDVLGGAMFGLDMAVPVKPPEVLPVYPAGVVGASTLLMLLPPYVDPVVPLPE